MRDYARLTALITELRALSQRDAPIQPDEISDLLTKLAPLGRSESGRINAEKSWAGTKRADRSARTAPARDAMRAKFLAEADGDPELAEELRSAFYRSLAEKSVETRRRNRDFKAALQDAMRPSVRGLP